MPPCWLQRLLKQSNQQQAQIDKLLKSNDKDTKISVMQREVDKLNNSISSCNKALDTCRSEKQRQVRQTCCSALARVIQTIGFSRRKSRQLRRIGYKKR